jgi:hypothetical protein
MPVVDGERVTAGLADDDVACEFCPRPSRAPLPSDGWRGDPDGATECDSCGEMVADSEDVCGCGNRLQCADCGERQSDERQSDEHTCAA